MLILYDYFRSSACFRVRIALNLKKVEYQPIPIHLVNEGGEQYSESYQSLNPQSLVPLLQNGKQLISQSLAIIEYLEDAHPAPALLPKDPYRRALVRAFALAIVADIHPINNLRILKYLSNEMNLNDQQIKKWYQHWIHKGLLSLEKQLIKNNLTDEFCFGNTPTLADICLIPQLYNARRYACDLSSLPTLMRIEANCQKHTAFQDAYPEAVIKEVTTTL